MIEVEEVHSLDPLVVKRKCINSTALEVLFLTIPLIKHLSKFTSLPNNFTISVQTPTFQCLKESTLTLLIIIGKKISIL